MLAWPFRGGGARSPARRAPDDIAVAESCTGGLLGAALTATRALPLRARRDHRLRERLKADHLGVGRHLLTTQGAVSAEVAMAMAVGACERFRATIGVGITGVAGPEASEQKPAGLVFVAVAGLDPGRCCGSARISVARPIAPVPCIPRSPSASSSSVGR